MVESTINIDTGTGRVLLTPNRSLSWYGNKCVLLGMSVLMLAMGVGLTLVGLWPMLLFIGIAVVSVWASLYLNSLQLTTRELVTLTDTEVILQSGRRKPEREVRFPRCWTHLVVWQDAVDACPERLFLRCYGQQTELARCLNTEDKSLLIRQMVSAIRPVFRR